MLELRSVSKSFPGVKALSEVSLTLRPGEIHGLVGENGAGKSTLMKIAVGLLAPDAGNLLLGGSPVRFRSYREAMDAGIHLVSQEIQVIPGSSVAENIMLDKMITRNRWGVINWPAINQQAEKFTSLVGLKVPPTTVVRELSAAQKQLVQIAKTLAAQARFLLLDEPTSWLTEHEAEDLRRILQNLRTRGVAILYVSHKLDEIVALSDRVTVLRDGELIGTKAAGELSKDEMVRMMIGRDSLEQRFGPLPVKGGREMLRVEGLTRRGKAQEISFTLRAGEILGWYGLVGAGRTETARLIIGYDQVEKGSIIVEGRAAYIGNVREALHNHSIGYVSENRKEEGLWLESSVLTNITMTIWRRLMNRFTRKISPRGESAVANSLINALSIRCTGLSQKTQTLSGGNQQKVCIAKWLAADCRILIIDEPTVGVDIGARDQIHQLIRELAEKQGKAVILISSDLPEVIKLSSRILIFRDQRIVGEIRDVDSPQRGFSEISQVIGHFLS